MEFKYTTLAGDVVAANCERRIPFSLANMIIEDTVAAVIDESGNYSPQMLKVVMWKSIIENYTDVVVDGIDELERYVNTNESDLIEEIKLHVDPDQIEWITKMIDKVVEYEKQRDGLDRLGTALRSMLETFVGDGSIQDIIKKLNT